MKTVLTILSTLLIAGSMVQIAAASEPHMRKSYQAQISTSEKFRNAINSVEGRAKSPWNDSSAFDRRNTFN